MITNAGIAKGIEHLDQLRNAERYREALSEVDALLEASPAHPYLLVQRSQIIQLSDEDCPHEWEQARDDLETACRNNPNSPGPWIELGHYQYAIEDDAESASRSFQKAVDLGRDALFQALYGQAKALKEKGDAAGAFSSLAEARTLWIARGKPMPTNLLEEFADLFTNNFETDEPVPEPPTRGQGQEA